MLGGVEPIVSVRDATGLGSAQVDWCAINISPHSISDRDFIDFLLDQLKNSALPPERICFELTETSALSNVMAARQFIDSLRDSGCRFALDDFGDGWSSLARLKHLSFDFLKVGSHFTKGVLGSAIDFAVVKAVNEIAHAMREQDGGRGGRERRDLGRFA